MKIAAIADLHLAFAANKPMDVFGENWKDHHKKIKESWIDAIGEDDIVIIAGDVSWGLKENEISQDFQWIHELPGKKLIFKGNHDLWWTTPSKMNKRFEDILFMHNTFYPAGKTAICGTRGWTLPTQNSEWTEHDEKIYRREQGRLRLSLQAARSNGFEDIICAMHYPPVEKNCKPNKFTEILEEFGVSLCIYGHLHGKVAHQSAFEGMFGGVRYMLLSADYVDFKPVILREDVCDDACDGAGDDCDDAGDARNGAGDDCDGAGDALNVAGDVCDGAGEP